VNP
jgi:pyridoxal 5'-phosphate synthase pdxS subunit